MSRWNTSAFEQAAAECLPPSGGTMEREGERDDVGEAQAGGHVVQGGQIVADIVGAVLIVVVVDAEDDGAIAVARGIEIAEHVVPRAGVGTGHSGAAEGEPGGGRLLVGHARIVGEARVAQGDDEVAAVARLGLLLAPQDQFEDVRWRNPVPGWRCTVRCGRVSASSASSPATAIRMALRGRRRRTDLSDCIVSPTAIWFINTHVNYAHGNDAAEPRSSCRRRAAARPWPAPAESPRPAPFPTPRRTDRTD